MTADDARPAAHPRKDSPDYRAGYHAGYRAGRVFKAITYRRQAWRCLTCDRFGFVLVRSDDTEPKLHWRLEQSHDAQSHGKRRCVGSNLALLSPEEYARAAVGACR